MEIWTYLVRHNLLGSSRSISKRSHNYSHQTYCQAHTELFVHEHQKFDDKMNSRIVWQECMCSHLLHMNTSCWKTTLWPLQLKEIGKWQILSITFSITLSTIIAVMIIHNITYNIGCLNSQNDYEIITLKNKIFTLNLHIFCQ